jgi:hypothetical protein
MLVFLRGFFSFFLVHVTSFFNFITVHIVSIPIFDFMKNFHNQFSTIAIDVSL